MKLDAVSSPRPVRVVYSDNAGVVRVAFSDGSTREYVTHDAAMVMRLRKLYSRNILKLVRELETLSFRPA